MESKDKSVSRHRPFSADGRNRTGKDSEDDELNITSYQGPMSTSFDIMSEGNNQTTNINIGRRGERPQTAGAQRNSKSK